MRSLDNVTSDGSSVSAMAAVSIPSNMDRKVSYLRESQDNDRLVGADNDEPCRTKLLAETIAEICNAFVDTISTKTMVRFDMRCN